MTTTTRTGAIYGIGVYGTSRYGVTGVILVPDGVQAVGTTDSGVNITADANHTVVSIVGLGLVGSIGPDQIIGDANVPVVGVLATGSVNANVTFKLDYKAVVASVQGTGNTSAPTVVAKAFTSVSGVSSDGVIGTATIVAKAVTLVTGVEGTAQLGTPTQKTVNRIPVAGVEATGEVGDLVLVAKAVTDITGVSATGICGTVDAKAYSLYIVTGVEATGAVNDVTIAENARPTFDGVEATGFVGTTTVTVTVFNYEAVRDLYAPQRTVYVDRRSTSQDRTVFVTTENRTVFVEASQSSNRVIYINAQPRVVTVGRRTTSDDREVLAA
jgi:hypothetical protein